MNLIYQDNVGGLFSLSKVSEWLPANKNTPLTNYTIILNFGVPLYITKDLNNYRLDEGDLCFLSQGSYISYLTAKDGNHCIIEFNRAFYCLELHDKELSCDGLLFGALPGLPKLTSTTDQTRNNRHLVEIFLDELKQKRSAKGEMLKILLKRLIIKCVRLAKEQLFIEKNPIQLETDIIRKFQALVEKHFQSKHKVADYAALMYKSPKTLSNTFKKLHHQTPLQIIQERIILEARRQLHYTDKTVKEIAYELGFSEPAQFSRLFKKISGMNPSEFQMTPVF